MKAKERYEVNLLKHLINEIRNARQYTISSDTLSEEAIYYLQEGYREGLCSAAMTLADELDARLSEDPDYDTNALEKEEIWWHNHDPKDIGTEERL